MKFAALIFSFLFISLAVHPCADAAINNDDCGLEVSHQDSEEQHDEEHSEDPCSPFCSCQCCYKNLLKVDLYFTLDELNYESHREGFHQLLLLGNGLSIWTPPKA